MFGSGLPVCAADFPAISELVQTGVNGLVFRTAAELATQVMTLYGVADVDVSYATTTNIAIPSPAAAAPSSSQPSSSSPPSSGVADAVDADDDYCYISHSENSESTPISLENSNAGGMSSSSSSSSSHATSSSTAASIVESPTSEEKLIQKLRLGARQISGWDENWTLQMAPLVAEIFDS